MKDIVMGTGDFIILAVLVIFLSGSAAMAFLQYIHAKERLYHKDGKEDGYAMEQNENYEKPVLEKLSEDEIEAIHGRGHITPAEQLKEWEDMDLCAPGDAIGSASQRCKKFHNCHDCLVDYASNCSEYTSMMDIMEESEFSLYGNSSGNIMVPAEKKEKTEDGEDDKWEG